MAISVICIFGIVLKMDKQLKHIVGWVKSKGIEIKRRKDTRSIFRHGEPNCIYIGRNAQHQITGTILHEYYHTQQFKHRILTTSNNTQVKFRSNIEYRAELFAIRCLRKLGIIYDKTFVEDEWGDEYYRYDKSDYYAIAYKLLIKNKVIN